jgi:hypothetical protein
MRDVGEALVIFATSGGRTLLGAAVLAAVLAASRPQSPLFQTLGGGALVICALAVFAACSTGSDSISGGLTVTREDGSIVEFEGSVRAWCGPPRDGGGSALQLGSGVPVGQSRPGGTRETERPRTYWLLFSLVERLERAPVLSLRERPIDSTTWTFFVNDLETGNEAAAKNERSSGTIVVSRWGCDRGDAVEVTFKAVVGSEFGDGEVVRAAGTVTTEIGDPPE